MAMKASAVQNGAVTPSEFADMVSQFAPPFLVDSKSDLTPTLSGNRLTVGSGKGLIGGIRVQLTSSESIEVPTSGSDVWAVVLRLDWSSSSSPLSLVAVDLANSGFNQHFPEAHKVNRVVGRMYDAVIAVVRGKRSRTLVDTRLWGGDGAPFYTTDSAWDSVVDLWYNLRFGMRFCTESDLESVKVLTLGNRWELIGGGNVKWKSFEPTLITQGEDSAYTHHQLDGNLHDADVTLGSGAVSTGRYRVVNGVLHGYIYIYTGENPSFGVGYIGIKLPLPMSNWVPEVNAAGYVSINSKAFPFALSRSGTEMPASLRIFPNSKYGLVFMPKNQNSNIFWAHRIARESSALSTHDYITGIPEPDKSYKKNPPYGVKYKFAFEYPVDL